MEYRIERDFLGEIRVPADKLWGAGTQRSFENFQIGTEKIPKEMVTAFGILKKACTQVNNRLGKLDDVRADAIIEACDDLLAGKLDGNFPLPVWQTGSGTQFNINISEVIANRANQYLQEKPDYVTVLSNDHVNMSQSSNDLFPTAMHITIITMIKNQLLPALNCLRDTFRQKSEEFNDIVKIGRTHFMDAIPLTLGQEISAWERMLERDKEMLDLGIEFLRDIAMGGMILGTGLNNHPNFAEMVAQEISNLTGEKFNTASNKFHSLTSKDEIVFLHGILKALAADLMKIANDIRLLASGPRCGIGEITIPANEAGSVIQPGKINPTQCEALTMVVTQVFGNDTTISFAASQGTLQLNVFMPVIVYNMVQSIRLLGDSMKSFNNLCAKGIMPNQKRIEHFLSQSLMLATGLVPLVGYDNATAIVKHASQQGITLKEAALASGLVSKEEYDVRMNPINMTKPLNGN